MTVLVPSNYAGLSVRRGLAGASAVVNVRFMIPARAAELLGAPALTMAGKRPLTPWVRQSAVRAALNAGPGVFSSAASHPSTARELGRVFRELRPVSETSLAALAASGERARDVVALYRKFRALTNGFFDENDLMEAAAEVLSGDSPMARETGDIVLYLPRDVPRPLGAMLTNAARSAGRELHAIFGLTGDPEVDAVTEAAAQDLGAPVRSECAPPSATRVISATEPEEEVREAIRQAMALTREGIPLHRIAFVYGSAEVYAGLLDDALSSAGIPHNGPSNRRLSQTIAGRTILGLPRLAASGGAADPGFARDVLMDWLTSAPIWHAGSEAPSHRWDDISRDAGIVRGPSQWQSRLEYYAAIQDLEAAGREPGNEAGPLRNAAWARDLAAFVEALVADLGTDEEIPPSGHARAALRWLDSYLPERALDNEEELDARERVKRHLEEIVAIGDELPSELDAPVSRSQFAAALEEALSEPAGRVASLGEGIFTGPITQAGEMDFDAVLVLGMVEGAFPSAVRDDPILTSPERARTGGELRPAGTLPTEGRRAYLAALHAAPIRILSTPRGDLRSQRATQPSRWLLEAASELHGGAAKVYATELGEMLVAPPPWFRVVHSFEAALRTAAEPASPQEWDLASLLRYHGRIDRHFLMRPAPDNALARGVSARKARARLGEGRLDGWIGKVEAGAAPVPGSTRPISPTALEQFANCPFRYFLGHVLHVGEIERPEELVTIAPATIGNIVHEILEHFFEYSGARPDPFADWSPEERARLHGLAKESFEAAERRGLTGKNLTWKAEQARILRDLELLLDRELRDRRRDRFRFRQAEARFGMDPRRGPTMDPAMLTLAGGEQIAFRGKVDRVDEGPNGELLITDYKTGSTRSYEDLKADDPLKGGRFLQLPVYALAFKSEEAVPVRARYWFISEQADFVSKEIILDAATHQRFGEVVSTLVETMREGYFPAVPGEETYRPGRDTYNNCAYCPYDALCPTSQRTEAWEAARRDPGLIPFATLAEAGMALEESSDA